MTESSVVKWFRLRSEILAVINHLLNAVRQLEEARSRLLCRAAIISSFLPTVGVLLVDIVLRGHWG